MADGLSENVLAAILEPITRNKEMVSAKNETILSKSTELDLSNGNQRIDTSLLSLSGDNTSNGFGSKRSLHSSRQTLVDSKEAYRQYGLKWLRAIRHDDMNTIRQMLEEKPELVHYAPLCAPNAIHLATARRNRNLVALLVKEGADIETRNMAGYTSLQIAVQLGDDKMAEFLIKQGANRKARDPNGLIVEDYGAWIKEMDGEMTKDITRLRPNYSKLTPGEQSPSNSISDSPLGSMEGPMKRDGLRGSWKRFFDKNTKK